MCFLSDNQLVMEGACLRHAMHEMLFSHPKLHLGLLKMAPSGSNSEIPPFNLVGFIITGVSLQEVKG